MLGRGKEQQIKNFHTEWKKFVNFKEKIGRLEKDVYTTYAQYINCANVVFEDLLLWKLLYAQCVPILKWELLS